MKQSIVKARNTYKITGDTGTLTIRRRVGNVTVTFDADRLDELQHHCWRIVHGRGKPYVGTYVERVNLFLHHLLVGGRPVDGLKVCFVNGDTLDYRAANLAIRTHAENIQTSVKKKTTIKGKK